MSRFYNLWKDRHTIILGHYFRVSEEAEARREQDHNAAVTIQSLWRAYLVRSDIKQRHRAATQIQRLFRGFMGRRLFRAECELAQQKQRRNFFNSAATKIQRVWKGHYVRTKVLDFYARKRYLSEVQLKNAQPDLLQIIYKLCRGGVGVMTIAAIQYRQIPNRTRWHDPPSIFGTCPNIF
ncbi:spermatogenesis associated 17-like [Planoprotostelium fungivorum]|uniref:Spermatogenesis associated 17-like n=1 Tax=Planoprotostelium fungivorum TaxID=1890364 RepID=A0A2P6N265_9EUKA|nr:spermatogenesis associated 17-like [Planoprotostelium fungivorum]